jgi:aldehyde dehydrogenase (NAD+)
MYLKANSPHAATAGKSVIGFNVINGKEVEGDLSLIQAKSAVDHRDLVGMFPDSGEKDVARAAKAAAEAFRVWSETPFQVREAIVLRTAGVLTTHREKLSRIITREIGMTPQEALEEVQETIDACGFFATAMGEIQQPARPSAGVRRRPIGVCGVLATGSSPLAAPGCKILPALLAGNTVVWKPSDNAPTTAYLLLRAMMEAGLPPGVVNTVNGRGRAGCGKHFLAGIDRGHFQSFSFVGSPALGRSVGEACGRSLVLPNLDLMVKGALVIMPDSDPDQAAKDAVQAAFGQAGQRPIGLATILVHEACAAPFKQRFLDRVASLEVGNPMTAPEVAYGPMINARSAAAFREHWDLGRAEGATLLIGGEQWTEANRTERVHGNISHGTYMQPCVWDGVAPDMGLFRHQIPGPMVGLATFTDLGEALKWLSEAPCGSAISLYSQDSSSIERFQRESQADIARLNTTTDDRKTLLSFTGHGTHPGCQPALDRFSRWLAMKGDTPASSVPASVNPDVPASTLKTDWDSL